MKKFNDLIAERAFNKESDFPSVTITHKDHTLYLRFDSKDVLVHAYFSGPYSPWLSSLCYLIQNKSLNEISELTIESWKKFFREDQTFWDFFQEEETRFINSALEMCHGALNLYRGRDYLYQEVSPLVCRCFGVRESDITEYLKHEDQPTLEGLGIKTKAGMGCRSCVPQLSRWFAMKEGEKKSRMYKDRPAAEWLLEIDQAIRRFDLARDWNMEIESFKVPQVIISFDREAGQLEVEKITQELQLFLEREVDPDLGFFLRRARHFSKAKG